MTREEYAIEVRRTMPQRNDDLQLAVYVLGLVGEAGELDNALESLDLYVSRENLDRLLKEAGDCYWYAFAIANSCGVTLDAHAPSNELPVLIAAQLAEYFKKYLGHGEPLDVGIVRTALCAFLSALPTMAGDEAEIMRLNVEKLRKRYPEGFSITASLERKE